MVILPDGRALTILVSVGGFQQEDKVVLYSQSETPTQEDRMWRHDGSISPS